MEFILEIIANLLVEGLFKWTGITVVWLFHFGQKPVAKIKTEDWNISIGIISLFVLLLFFVIII